MHEIVCILNQSKGTASFRPCPRGTSKSSPSRAESKDQCTKCPIGYYCRFDETGNVENINEKRCAQGYVCVEGSYLPTPDGRLPSLG